MLRKTITFLMLFMICTCLFATGENWPIGGRSAGMANSSVTFNDFWSIHNNQAGLAGVKNFSAGIYYEDRFGMQNLGIKAGAVVLPTKFGVFGLSMTYFGYSLYNESKIGLAYAKSFGEKFSVGVQLDYLSTHIAENYGNNSAVAAEIGLRYQINSKLCIATHIFNLNRAKIAEYNDERIPTVFRLGLSYAFSEKVVVTAESEKDIQYDAVFKAGLEYHPIDVLYIRTGVSTNPFQNAFGFGLEFKNFKIDIAASYHQTLGFTPQVSIVFNTTKSTGTPTFE